MEAINQALLMIDKHSSEGARLRESFLEKERERIVHIGLRLAYTLAKGHKILLCGNGGSAADCQHIAAELTNRFQIDRPPLAAIALTTDTSALTAIGNDFSFNQIFSKQLAALGQKGDLLIGISTSGNSQNVIEAFWEAEKKDIYCLGFTGRDGGDMLSCSHASFVVPSESTALIQEVHITLGHLLCSLIDYYLFENTAVLSPYLQGEKNLPL